MERGGGRLDAGICSYSGWMWERKGVLSLAAARMLPLLVAVAAAPRRPLAAAAGAPAYEGISLSEVLKQPSACVDAAAAEAEEAALLHEDSRRIL